MKKRKAKEKRGQPFISKLMSRKEEISLRINSLEKEITYLRGALEDLNKMQRLWKK